MKKINYNFNDLSVNVFIYLFTASDKNRHWALDWTDQWLELTIESCTWPKIEVFPLNTSCDLQAGDDNRHRCRLCFFVSFFLLGHSEVETSRTSPQVASPCSCLPALREGFAVNKRLGHQRGGVIHGVVSSLMSYSVSVHVKYLFWSEFKIKSRSQDYIWEFGKHAISSCTVVCFQNLVT